MIIRSRAPLRLGFAGGGTDLETYSNANGGAVLNATISMYAYCTLIPTDNGKICIYSYDNKNDLEIDSIPEIAPDGDKLILHRGVYNRIVKEFNGGKPLSFIMSTSNDAPVGSGLGTSSTMIVAILEAFNKWLGLGLNEYQKAQLAYDIERKDLKLAGGKQDQYSAVFGGFNFMEFLTDGSVNVHPLDLDKKTVNELECSMILYYGGQSRRSADQQFELTKNIISHQIQNAAEKKDATISALDALKRNAYDMKNHILSGNVAAFSECIKKGWEDKKKTSSIVTNVALETTIDFAMKNGAKAVKVSGAGGGGFLLLLCDPVYRQKLTDALKTLDGSVYSVKFNFSGAESWTND